jgi:lipopolysaccharide export system permease protein
MRLLDRYLLRELLIPLFYCLCGFVMLSVLFDLFAQLNHFQGSKLHARDIVQYYLVGLPGMLALVLPVVLLLALLYALGNHGRHHELTAIRAAGISVWRLCLPYFAVGFLAAGCLFALNELLVPDAAEAQEEILVSRLPRPRGAPGPHQIRSSGFVNASEGRKWEWGEYNLDTGGMIKPNVHWTQPNGSILWISAERAVRTNGVWTFFDVREYIEQDETNAFPTPLLQTNALAFPQFTETPEAIKSELKLASRVSLPGKKLSNTDIPITEILTYLRFHPNPSESDARLLYTKLHERLAAPWACVVAVLIGIPFAAGSGRRNVFVGVASSLSLCVAYLLLQRLGSALSLAGFAPPWLGAWLPNMSFATLGLWLMARLR